MIARDYSDKDLRAALGSSPPLEKMKMAKEHGILLELAKEAERLAPGEWAENPGWISSYDTCTSVFSKDLNEVVVLLPTVNHLKPGRAVALRKFITAANPKTIIALLGLIAAREAKP